MNDGAALGLRLLGEEQGEQPIVRADEESLCDPDGKRAPGAAHAGVHHSQMYRPGWEIRYSGMEHIGSLTDILP